ncbi:MULTISPECIES: general stress protein [Pseudomonas]|uniref:general stress protein n=1 Tax=Pseudomonas TaxID=286 RepID=UPI0009B7E0A9|nr:MULTISPECIES: general stress protein [Pseudomonas]NWE05015.1 general stress protein [Pseudomonas sp. IPO3749]NWF24615.1 general stress protein [Pseudomonas sp. IPO3749]
MANTGNSNPGNFANDPEKASEAGKKGGEHRHGSGGNTSGSGGNFANDPEKASEAGKKGGEHSHGGEKNS